MTATLTDHAQGCVEQFIDLNHLHPGISIPAAARRLNCYDDTLRRWLVAAHAAGDARIPADILPKPEPERPTIKAEEQAKRKTWTPFAGDPRLKRAAAWTCANNATDAPELDMLLSQLGLTAKDARP